MKSKLFNLLYLALLSISVVFLGIGAYKWDGVLFGIGIVLFLCFSFLAQYDLNGNKKRNIKSKEFGKNLAQNFEKAKHERALIDKPESFTKTTEKALMKDFQKPKRQRDQNGRFIK